MDLKWNLFQFKTWILFPWCECWGCFYSYRNAGVV